MSIKTYFRKFTNQIHSFYKNDPYSFYGAIGLFLLVLIVPFLVAKENDTNNVSHAATCTGQAITPSTNIQQAVNNAPQGTTFCFSPGTYANVSIAPKTGDIFDGDNQQAILDGQNAQQYAFVSGISSSGQSFGSTASNVTIQGFVIQNYNSPTQNAAVESFGTSGWTIQNNHITHNASAGVATDSNVKVLNNLIDWNGQEGYTAGGSNILYQGNEIAHNNPNLAADATWEAGGGKAWATTYATFSYNNVHDNGGNGMWDDTSNIYITYDHNTVTNNWGAGIVHEIGYDAVITNNIVSSNGMPTAPGGGEKPGWLWDAGIELRRSGAVNPQSIPPPAGWPSVGTLLIANNTVTNNANGISCLESPANGGTGNGSQEAHLPNGTPALNFCQNILVRDNIITMSQGATGMAEDGGGGTENPEAVFTSLNNHFTHNAYYVSNLNHPNDGYTYDWFSWEDGWPDWSGWKGYGNDTTGNFQIGMPPTTGPSGTMPTVTSVPTGLPTAIPTPTVQPTGTNVTAGYPSWNGNFDNGNNNWMSSTQVTTGAVGGPLQSITLYIGKATAPSNHIQIAMYTDNGSNSPGILLRASGTQVLVANRWNTIPLSGVTIMPNTKYFLVFNVDNSRTQYGWNSQSIGVSRWKSNVRFGTWPSTFGKSSVSYSEQYAIYMTY